MAADPIYSEKANQYLADIDDRLKSARALRVDSALGLMDLVTRHETDIKTIHAEIVRFAQMTWRADQKLEEAQELRRKTAAIIGPPNKRRPAPEDL